MKRRWHRGVTIFGAVVGLLTLSGWIALHPKHHDPYPFLASRPLIDVRVQGPGSFGPKEHRLYCWKQPLKEVAAQASQELPKFGLKIVKLRGDTGTNVSWAAEIIEGGPCGASSDTWIAIYAGQNRSIAGQMKHMDNDPEWTTVVVSSALDESWINVLRYTFFGLRRE